MRIASLARKIKIAPSKISTYAESIEIDLSKGSNTKLNDEEVQQILDYFDKTLEEPKQEVIENIVAEVQVHEEETIATPSLKQESIILEEINLVEEVEIRQEIEAPIVSNEKVETTKEEEVIPPVKESVEESIVETERSEEVHSSLIERNDDEVEDLSYAEKLALDENTNVIKPKKVQLQGLTVKGKIDLPEPKPKMEASSEEDKKKEETLAATDEIRYTKGPDRKRRKPQDRRRRRKNNINPVEAERRRKQREAEIKEEQRKKKVKQQKAEHYQKLMADQKPPTQKVKRKPSKKAPQQPQLEPTNNVFKKFWRWMNT
ncbi:hypothetical protein [Reichenbachiella versicolor]|uniref:hypothetical protein n=1 Tax=Reichenbachiella versicolor TaxID=1821036 RepID=UPI000D6E20D9|nr:hypothetical protein [Reichenbachiella versicolor]